MTAREGSWPTGISSFIPSQEPRSKVGKHIPVLEAGTGVGFRSGLIPLGHPTMQQIALLGGQSYFLGGVKVIATIGYLVIQVAS